MSLLACLTFMIAASAYDETFNAGCSAYGEGDYGSAIERFEQLAGESIVNPIVFFNLGNAYYRNGSLGPAIANYERALQLDPNFGAARENLTTAVKETKHRLAPPAPPEWKQSLLFWHYGLSQRATYTWAALSWLALWIALSIRQWRPLRFTRGVAVVAGILAVAFGASAWEKAHPVELAVANAETVPVHYGTSENETVRFELSEGDRVIVDKRATGWARVVTAEGERGWAQDKHLAFVGPPYERPAGLEPVAAQRTEP